MQTAGAVTAGGATADATGGGSVRSRRGRRVGVNVAVPLVFAALVTVLLNSSTLLPGGRIVLIVVVSALLVASIVFQVARAVLDSRVLEASAVDELRIAMKSSLLPVATFLAAMPNLSLEARRTQVQVVAQKAADVLTYLLLKHVDGVRTNVFVLNRAGTTLTAPFWAGHGDAPGTFLAGYPSADDALARVKTGVDLIASDVLESPPRGYGRGSSAPYRSFVSIIIKSGEFSYGMLTVDSPQPRALRDTDVQTIRVVAELLAVGFAMAYPGESTGSSR